MVVAAGAPSAAAAATMWAVVVLNQAFSLVCQVVGCCGWWHGISSSSSGGNGSRSNSWLLKLAAKKPLGPLFSDSNQSSNPLYNPSHYSCLGNKLSVRHNLDIHVNLIRGVHW